MTRHIPPAGLPYTAATIAALIVITATLAVLARIHRSNP